MQGCTTAEELVTRIGDDEPVAVDLNRSHSQQYGPIGTFSTSHTGTKRPMTGLVDRRGMRDRVTGV
jgi:hypothetical protein